MRKLRFCFITSFYPPFHPGGCGLHVYHLANCLSKDGHQVEVICSGEAHAYKITDPREGDYPHHPGVTVHRVTTGTGKIEPLLTYLAGRPFFSRRRIRDILDTEFDVIHYHNISLFGGISLLGMGRGVKLFTQHTYWLFCPAHYLWKMGREVCESKDCLRCLWSYRKPPQFWRWTGIRDRLLPEVDSLIMPCRFMIEQHREEGFTERMDCLPYFVAPVKRAGNPALEVEFGDLKPFFLFVARFERYKGPQVAVSAFRKKIGDAKLVMVGTGTMEEELREMARGDPRIRFLDYIDPEKLDWLYANALALLAPSVWPEMGNQTVIQAQSCGTPAIASEVGLLPELVRDHDAGLIFRTEDELVAAMDKMENPAVREEFVDPCLRAYKEEYTPEKYLQRYYRLLNDFSVGM